MNYYLVKLLQVKYFVIFIGVFIFYGIFVINEINARTHNREKMQQPVAKKVLDNGLTVLVYESHKIPKVCFQIWYDVGSKVELSGEKGIAHFIEHMIFKGTKDVYSESDINTIVHKLSGSCNAFTSYDYTGYEFIFPTHHWKEAFPIAADCMINCAFKDDMLDSEMKAVIQELKLYRDQYARSLLMEMISVMFPDHPYHDPVIGYKSDIWHLSGKDLLTFYQKHYKPNNATIVVVGDVNTEEVFALAEGYFGHIPKDPNYTKQTYSFQRDIVSRSVTLYRDVAQPIALYGFVVPGAIEKQDATLELLEWVIGKGSSSRLYKKLVNEEQIATDVSTVFFNLFDHGVFFIVVEPKNINVLDAIEKNVIAQLQDLTLNGVQKEELERGLKKTQMSFYSLLEHINDQAYEIGQSYLSTGDENYIFTYLEKSLDTFKKEAQYIINTYFRTSIMNKGFVLPLAENEKKEWSRLQQESDAQDTQILVARNRLTEIEPAKYAETIEVKDGHLFVFPKPDKAVLSNGMKVLSYYNEETPKINIILDFKARSYFDSVEKPGLYTFMAEMLSEGTKNYTSEELAEAIESRGMSLDIEPGVISLKMLHHDFKFGLEILREVLMNATFLKDEIEKVRHRLLAALKHYWDEPRSFTGQLVREQLYKGHPYSKCLLGTKESITTINQDDLLSFYKKYISPQGARIAIVGNLANYDIVDELEKTFGNWKGNVVEDIEFSNLIPSKQQTINYFINRDQIILCFAQLSIARKNPDFDKYLLFDQILGGGVLGSMSSRLFDLREKSGLFYTIQGTLLAGCDEQPGMFQIKTIVSLDRLEEAEKVIKNTIDTVVDTITEKDLEEAKRAVINSLVDNFASNSDIASTFLYLDRFNLPANYFDTRAIQLNSITLDEVKNAVKNILNSENIVTVRVGRV